MDSTNQKQIKQTKNSQDENGCPLNLACPPLHSLKVTGTHHCLHISCVTSDRVWVSDGENLALTNTKGDTLHIVNDLFNDFNIGPHTVNNKGDLVYIATDADINILSKDMKTKKVFVKRTDETWRPRCVYCSLNTGNLMVGMSKVKPLAGIVAIFNKSGQCTQTIKNDNAGLELYTQPSYMTENNNGDVVVSDSNALVVTEREGRHRFSYTGHPTGSGVQPKGICTDALSHILVCDHKNKTVQMLDKDGQFLYNLPIRLERIYLSRSLCYDFTTHSLWVGSENNNLACVYKYDDRQDLLTGKCRMFSYLQEAMLYDMHGYLSCKIF